VKAFQEEPHEVLARFRGFYSNKEPSSIELIQTILVLQVALNSFLFLFDIQLVIFHIYITAKGFSTFDFILYRREKAEQLDLLKQG
jgi:hypothetical protein